MSECYDSIADVVIPLTILNFVGTAVIILIAKCTEGWWASTSSTKIHMENETKLITDEEILEITDDDLIAQIRASTESDHVLSTRDELSGDQASLESMAGTLISVTKNIAGALDTANHIPKQKKEELASLLKGVPGFISKIVDMDDEQLNTLLSTNKSDTEEEDNKQSKPIIMKTCGALTEDHKKESDYLMKTLDSLRQ